MTKGDVFGLGRCMTKAQDCFDECLMPLCPEQLNSPKLHAVMSNPLIKAHSIAAKGVGSQGKDIGPCVDYYSYEI